VGGACATDGDCDVALDVGADAGDGYASGAAFIDGVEEVGLDLTFATRVR
jgi:hypothetical protein